MTGLSSGRGRISEAVNSGYCEPSILATLRELTSQVKLLNRRMQGNWEKTLVDSTRDEIAWRCHANCIEYARETAGMSRFDGAIVERDGVLLFATGSDFPVLVNGAFRVDSAVEADAVIDLADAWFRERGRGWSLGTSSWLGADQDLVDAALRRGMKATRHQYGLDGGAPYVTLQATTMGEPIYRRMGYRELYRFANFTRFA